MQSAWAKRQRVWNRQPLGGAIGDGTSPATSSTRRRSSGIGHRHGVEQRPGVGVAGCGEQLVGGGGLDDPAEVHHRHAVGDVLDDPEVVGHDEVGEVELVLQPLEQVDDLRLDGHVECGHRLVADDQPRREGERTGDADALTLTAGEGGGKAVVVLGVEPDELHQLLRPGRRSPPSACRG